MEQLLCGHCTISVFTTNWGKNQAEKHEGGGKGNV